MHAQQCEVWRQSHIGSWAKEGFNGIIYNSYSSLPPSNYLHTKSDVTVAYRPRWHHGPATARRPALLRRGVCENKMATDQRSSLPEESRLHMRRIGSGMGFCCWANARSPRTIIRMKWRQINYHFLITWGMKALSGDRSFVNHHGRWTHEKSDLRVI